MMYWYAVAAYPRASGVGDSAALMPDGWLPSRSLPAVTARIGAKVSPDCPGPARLLPAAASAILVDKIEAVAPRRLARDHPPLLPAKRGGAAAWSRPTTRSRAPFALDGGPAYAAAAGPGERVASGDGGASSIVMTGLERQPGGPDHRQAPPPAGEVPSMDNRASGKPRGNGPARDTSGRISSSQRGATRPALRRDLERRPASEPPSRTAR